VIGNIVALVSGFVFAVGLALSGMTSPRKVIGFLDLTGAWDPALALVMLGAIAVYAAAHAFGRRMTKPLIASAFASLAQGHIDRRLVLGSAMFGAGWGLAGYCPGPALVSSATGALPAVVFTLAMVLAFWVTRYIDGRRHERTTAGARAGR
jgi:uncharacterized membrane protein YedE/YeeE